MDAQLNSIFQASVDSKKVPGVAAYALDRSGSVLYSNAFGNTTVGDTNSPNVTPDTQFVVYSCTKLFTSIAALQLVEQGKLDLQAPVEQFVPSIGKMQRLAGFDDSGTAILKPAGGPIRVIHLLTHTSGMVYDFFDGQSLRWRVANGATVAQYNSMADVNQPLVHAPGDKYTYGVSTEWLGLVVEAVSGLELGEYIKQHITDPLQLHSTGGYVTPEQSSKVSNIHMKDTAGNLTPTPIRGTASKTNELHEPGGTYMYSCVKDYGNFLLTLLNEGRHPTLNVRILKPETVRDYLFTDLLPQIGAKADDVGEIRSAVPQLSCSGTMLPNVKKGQSAGLLINYDAAPNGRSAGSGSWAGLANCYYWVDPTAGRLGVVFSSILPFMDKDVLYLFDALERAVYGKPAAKEVAEAGSNFSGGENETA